jgi:hypothetical protein
MNHARRIYTGAPEIYRSREMSCWEDTVRNRSFAKTRPDWRIASYQDWQVQLNVVSVYMISPLSLFFLLNSIVSI